MSKQFAHHLEFLYLFLVQASGRAPGGGRTTGATVEDVMLGCMVIQSLARNFQVQQRDQVRFTEEQSCVRLLVQGVEAWLSEAKVCEQRGGTDVHVPLLDWLRRMSQSVMPLPIECAVDTAPLAPSAASQASECAERVEKLVLTFEQLQQPSESWCASTRRFLRPPTVGSLHQLRAELLTRYSGRHLWIPTGYGGKLDAMFIARQGDNLGEGAPSADDFWASARVAKDGEDVPLKNVDEFTSYSGPVIVWCNPNAAYYETMAYESHWLDFYLSQGCSVIVFNYSGFGRSTGNPSPATLAADGCAVVAFLKKRGFTQIGVHGRSIGGIAACGVAKAHPDVVKLLVADRTFSTLAKVAKFTFGNWAVKALSLSATWADNLENFSETKCYKIMICDPKDATIPDLTSLRTAVALQAMEQVPAAERLGVEPERAQRLSEAWCFFHALLGLCDDRSGCEDNGCTKCLPGDGRDARRPARSPVIGKPTLDSEVRLDVAGEDERLVAPAAAGGPVNAQWLEANPEAARAVMAPHVDAIRLALDAVASQLNGGGMTLDEAVGLCYDDPHFALRCFCANIQMWGSIGNLREPLCSAIDRDIETILNSGIGPEDAPRLTRVLASLTPDRLATYHKQLARALVAQARREFRSHLVGVRRALEAVGGRDDGLLVAAELAAAVLAHLQEVEDFMTSIYRFFKCADVGGGRDGVPGVAPPPVPLGRAGADAGASSDSERGDPEHAEPRPLAAPSPDRSSVGHVVPIDCGHNGVLSDGELLHLSLHIRASRFSSPGPGTAAGARPWPADEEPRPVARPPRGASPQAGRGARLHGKGARGK